MKKIDDSLGMRGPRWRKRISTTMIYVMNNVVVDPQSECWIWQGRRGPGSSDDTGDHYYGAVNFRGRDGDPKDTGAHRVVWRAYHGQIPDGLWVCHTCDNTLCCNPEHLFLDTPEGNTRDMIQKNRHPIMKPKQRRWT